MKTLCRISVLLCLICSARAPAEEEVFHLPIGDPAGKDREVPLVLDAITDSQTGELVTPAELPARLADVRILFVGESHTSIDFHRVQRRVIEELHRAGRQVLIGLEMYPYTEQEHLDGWVAGHYTEDGFIEQSEWYTAWSYHWNYYRDIFLLAREEGLRMFAVNTPREVIAAVRRKGFQDLTAEEAAHIPDRIDTESAEYLRLFKAYFSEDDLHGRMTNDAQWTAMLRAQCTWDATMGYNSVQAFKQYAGPDAIMVVLIGTGHVSYGLGIERQAKQWFDGKMASIIPIPIRDDDDEPVTTIRASFADFVWGLPPESDPLYPGLGISTREIADEDYREVIFVAKNSVGRRGGFHTGDVLISMDGIKIHERATLNRLMAGKRWGDDVAVVVQRGEEMVNLDVLLRRVPEDEDGGGDGDGDEDEE